MESTKTLLEKDNLMCVVFENGDEYKIFLCNSHSTDHAIELCEEHTDTPYRNILGAIKMPNTWNLGHIPFMQEYPKQSEF